MYIVIRLYDKNICNFDFEFSNFVIMRFIEQPIFQYLIVSQKGESRSAMLSNIIKNIAKSQGKSIVFRFIRNKDQ
jgi:hypothetical protein